MLDHRMKGFGGRGEDFHGAAAVVPHLRRRIADADEFCALKYRRRSVGKLEVEAPADSEDHVGVAHDCTAHGADDRRMAVRHQAAALAGIKIDRAKPIKQRDQFRPGAAGAATGNHQYAAR